MTGVAMNTVLKLLADIGEACDEFQDKAIRGLKSTRRVQCDEVWSFCYAKDRNVPKAKQGEPGVGSVWTWTAIDADSKLILTWFIGDRDANCGVKFMLDVASRVDGRIQLTTDGHRPYREAASLAFPDGVDYAQLIKIYGGVEVNGPDTRYSPPVCCGIEKHVREGYPDPEHISTSYVERSNLTMRMGMRRFTRLTNGHSKKIANHRHAIALHFMFYNFARVHSTLKTTPAVDAGVADHVWTLDEIIGLIPEKPAGRFRKIGLAAE
jgi:IS1 family transposase